MKDFFKKLACDWLESKDSGESCFDFQLNIPTKRNLIRMISITSNISNKKTFGPFEPLAPFSVCYQAHECTVGDNNAFDIS